ncbi:MAG: MMPL family transporter [Planctomycetaceae bacterium]
MRINPESLAQASARHPWRVIVVWALVVVALGTASQLFLKGALTNDIAFTNSPESVQAQKLIEDNVTGKQTDTEYLIVKNPNLPVTDPAFEQYVKSVQGKVLALGSTVIAPPAPGQQASVVTVYDLQAAASAATDPRQQAALQAQAEALVSKDGHGTIVPVPVVDIEAKTIDALRGVVASAQEDGYRLLLAGQGTLQADSLHVAEQDLRKGEGIGLGVALIVLVVVFGAILAALLPIGIAMVAIPVALGLVGLISELTGVHFSVFTQNIASMIGLAVGIDYSLFIVARYREERMKGFQRDGAIGATGATASRAVLFSGMTVVFALLGMFILPTTIFRSMAAGAILVVLASLAATMTLLPALLRLLGDRINWPRFTKRARMEGDHDPQGGFWDRFTRTVMARPVVFMVSAIVVLGSLGLVYFSIEKGTTQSAASLPDDVESKQAFISLERDFGVGGQTLPIQIVVDAPASDAATQQVVGAIQQGVAGIPALSPDTTLQPAKDGSLVVVDAIAKGDAFSQATFQAVRDLRDQVVPAATQGTDVQVLVGGQPAIFTDFIATVDSYTPIVFLFVLGLSFLLLMMVFRSVVVPIKAVIMNLLSVGAAYGAIVLVFQHQSNSVLNAIHEFALKVFNALGFPFKEVAVIEAWLPLMLFSILFGLSMDYHVFLLSRIREEYDKTGDNDEAVAYGLRTTAGIITGAAIIMVVVFTAFAAGRLVPLQQMGFGLAVAVFLDATVVRSILVPSTMKLLGDLNWYLPKWLEWLPNLKVEGHEPDMVQVPDTAEELLGVVEPAD